MGFKNLTFHLNMQISDVRKPIVWVLLAQGLTGSSADGSGCPLSEPATHGKPEVHE